MSDPIDPDLFSPDKHRLDEELVLQPRLYYEHAVKLADARSDYERSIAAQDLTWAEMDKMIRTDPASYELVKATESSVKEAITRSKRYQRAVLAVIDARKSMDDLQAAVTALDHRKRALEKLVDLQLANYFSTPSPKDRFEREERTKKDARTAGQKKRAESDDD